MGNESHILKSTVLLSNSLKRVVISHVHECMNLLLSIVDYRLDSTTLYLLMLDFANYIHCLHVACIYSYQSIDLMQMSFSMFP